MRLTGLFEVAYKVTLCTESYSALVELDHRERERKKKDTPPQRFKENAAMDGKMTKYESLDIDIEKNTNSNSMKDMGKVMGELKKSHSDEIDFAKAGSLIKELLNKQ